MYFLFNSEDLGLPVDAYLPSGLGLHLLKTHLLKRLNKLVIVLKAAHPCHGRFTLLILVETETFQLLLHLFADLEVDVNRLSLQSELDVLVDRFELFLVGLELGDLVVFGLNLLLVRADLALVALDDPELRIDLLALPCEEFLKLHELALFVALWAVRGLWGFLQFAGLDWLEFDRPISFLVFSFL